MSVMQDLKTAPIPTPNCAHLEGKGEAKPTLKPTKKTKKSTEA